MTNVNVSVTIRATGIQKFKGFLLQARRIGGGNENEPIGFFASDAAAGTKVICRGQFGVSNIYQLNSCDCLELHHKAVYSLGTIILSETYSCQSSCTCN